MIQAETTNVLEYIPNITCITNTWICYHRETRRDVKPATGLLSPALHNLSLRWPGHTIAIQVYKV